MTEADDGEPLADPHPVPGGSGRWDDLAARLGSGALVAVVGLFAVWLGGPIFLGFIALVAGIMVWELVRMLSGAAFAVPMAFIAVLVIVVGEHLPPGFALPLLLAPAMIGIGQLAHNRTLFAVFSTMILVACFGLLELRSVHGFLWMMWLALVVIVTDVFGYFAGRFVGGPKFWPRVSPKKTWSGTAAGWVGSAAVGFVFLSITGAGAELIGVSVAISMASQIGDIAESAMKRQMGIKDSSQLLPGHGGLFDRFDGMLGASVFLLLVEALVDFPPPPI